VEKCLERFSSRITIIRHVRSLSSHIMLLHLFKLFLAWTLNLKANSAIWHIRIAMRSSTLTAIVSQVWIFFLLWRRRTHCYFRYLPSLQRWKGRQVLSNLGEQQRGWVFTVPRRLSAFWCTIDILRRRRYGVQFSFPHIPLSEPWQIVTAPSTWFSRPAPGSHHPQALEQTATSTSHITNN
jgi:hypothetical protein